MRLLQTLNSIATLSAEPTGERTLRNSPRDGPFNSLHGHPPKGPGEGRRGCHIEFDWILIHCLSEDEMRPERIGTHSD